MIRPAIPAKIVADLAKQEHFPDFQFSGPLSDQLYGFANYFAKRLKKDPGILTPELYLVMFENALKELPHMTVEKLIADEYLKRPKNSAWRDLTPILGYREEDYYALRYFYKEIAEQLFPGHTAFAEEVGNTAKEMFEQIRKECDTKEAQ